jgi:NADPH-dependent curcumin reductase CurA
MTEPAPPSPDVNRRLLLRRRPEGRPGPECFELVTEPRPTPAEGEALVEVAYLSIDPTIRGWMAYDTYLPAIGIGEVIRSGGAGRVVASRNPAYPEGALVFGMTGWQDYALVGPTNPATVLPEGVELTDALSVYGVTGITAYVGMLDIGRPQAGETVLVSGAAGATGSVAGQLAKIRGCRVVGIAGTPDKCRWLVEEAGFDAAIDYRREDVGARIGELCPDGVDVFFDNVGGAILEAALDHLALGARVVLCGAIAGYNDVEPQPGPRNLFQLIVRRARMEGFIVLDHLDRFGEAALALAGWVAEGRIRHRVDVLDGLERAPEALNRLFDGTNTGKQLVRVR